MHPMNVPATFEVRSLLALPVPELIGAGGGGLTTSQKIGSVPGYAHTLYPPINGDFLHVCPPRSDQLFVIWIKYRN